MDLVCTCACNFVRAVVVVVVVPLFLFTFILCRSLAIAHRESGANDAARRAFCAAVTLAPLLWCAWNELALLVDDDRDELVASTVGLAPQLIAPALRSTPLALPRHWMRALFAVRAHRHLEHNVACVRLVRNACSRVCVHEVLSVVA